MHDQAVARAAVAIPIAFALCVALALFMRWLDRKDDR